MITISALLVAALSVMAPFDPKGGHIQGMCAGGGNYYLSQMTRLYKVDKTGKCVKSVPVVSHTGDLCYREGFVYTAVAVYGGKDKGKGKVQVFDSDLNLVREATFDRGLDGIACFNGALYVGQGAHLQSVPHKEGEIPQSQTPHLENEMLILDPQTLAVKAHRVYSHGYKTRYGAQNIATDGKCLYVTFYSGENGAPDLVTYDAELRPLKHYVANASTGLEYGSGCENEAHFLKCVSKGGKGKPIAATIERAELKPRR